MSDSPLAPLSPQDRSESIVIPAAATPLDLAVAAWLDAKRGRSGSARTAKAYADTLADFRGALRAAGLDLDADGRAIALAAQRWAQSSRRGRSVKRSTVAQRLNILSSFYGFALRRGLLHLSGNPIDVVERPRVEAYATARSLDPAAVNAALVRLRRQADTGHAPALRDLALLRVMLTTGRRVAEVAGLRWRDVQIQGGRRVELSYRAKGDKVMRDALAASVASDLFQWLHAHYGPALGELAPDAAIWPALRPGRATGSSLTAQGVAEVVERHLGTHPHALRHAFAAAMIESGAKLPELQARLGHSSLETTGRYVAKLQQAHNPQAEQLASLFSGIEG